MKHEDLKGHFHVHITYTNHHKKEINIKGWKNTIILINKDNREQTDVMITRHYVVPSSKTPELVDVILDMAKTSNILDAYGCKITRHKLEHESLPTLPVSDYNYRECHIKIRVPSGYQVTPPRGYVQSRNAMDSEGQVYFLNARFYSGTVEEIATWIERDVASLKWWNPLLEVLEVKQETTIQDSNHDLDSWWA